MRVMNDLLIQIILTEGYLVQTMLCKTHLFLVQCKLEWFHGRLFTTINKYSLT